MEHPAVPDGRAQLHWQCDDVRRLHVASLAMTGLRSRLSDAELRAAAVGERGGTEPLGDYPPPAGPHEPIPTFTRETRRLFGRRLEELEVVALGVLERRDAAPWVVADLTYELHPRVREAHQFVVQGAIGLQRQHGSASGPGTSRRPAGVQADLDAVGVQLRPVIALIGHREPEGLPVEPQCTTHVYDGHPHRRHTTRHRFYPPVPTHTPPAHAFAPPGPAPAPAPGTPAVAPPGPAPAPPPGTPAVAPRGPAPPPAPGPPGGAPPGPAPPPGAPVRVPAEGDAGVAAALLGAVVEAGVVVEVSELVDVLSVFSSLEPHAAVRVLKAITAAAIPAATGKRRAIRSSVMFCHSILSWAVSQPFPRPFPWRALLTHEVPMSCTSAERSREYCAAWNALSDLRRP